MVLYALVQAASGEDVGHDCYSYTPEPDILKLFTSETDAIKGMEDEVKEILADCDESENVEIDDSSKYYRILTNTDDDWCIVLKVQSISI